MDAYCVVWQVKLCDLLVTNGPCPSALEVYIIKRYIVIFYTLLLYKFTYTNVCLSYVCLRNTPIYLPTYI